MTKEQYFIFKSDLKKAVEYTKLDKKHRKVYYNDGFETRETQLAALAEDNRKMKEIRESLKINISAEDHCTHFAYYIAKHQLSGDEMNQYIEDSMKKMKNYEPYMLKYATEDINKLLKKYAEIVCTD